MTAKLLFVKKHYGETTACSATIDETRVSWRSFDDEDALQAPLRKERFTLVLVDHREGIGDELDFVQALRKFQAGTNMLLICRKLELDSVVRAIRLNVRDLFHPPLDFQAVANCIRTLLPPHLTDEMRAEDWDILSVFLSEKNL